MKRRSAIATLAAAAVVGTLVSSPNTNAQAATALNPGVALAETSTLSVLGAPAPDRFRRLATTIPPSQLVGATGYRIRPTSGRQERRGETFWTRRLG